MGGSVAIHSGATLLDLVTFVDAELGVLNSSTWDASRALADEHPERL